MPDVMVTDGLGELDLDADHSAIVTLDDEVDLAIERLARAEVEHSSLRCLGVDPDAQTDERLEEGSQVPSRPQEAHFIEIHQASGERRVEQLVLRRRSEPAHAIGRREPK